MTTAAADLSAQLTAALDRITALEAQLAELGERRDGPGPRFDALQAAFTDRFRGSRDEVTQKLRAYLPDVRRVVEPAAGGVRVVDVGCGRAEWLDLLRAEGIEAEGVDLNADFVEAASSRGLRAVRADGIDHLRGLPAGSVDLVTSFHLIEHLSIEVLLAMFEAAYAALRRGGCLLLETPNPVNVIMGACNFYLDPTHRSPLPPALTEHLVLASGFVDVEVRPLHGDETPWPTGGSGADPAFEEAVRRVLYGPRDYAVLGYRAALPAGVS
jgi:SAM-dependent methyltransferase